MAKKVLVLSKAALAVQASLSVAFTSGAQDYGKIGAARAAAFEKVFAENGPDVVREALRVPDGTPKSATIRTVLSCASTAYKVRTDAPKIYAARFLPTDAGAWDLRMKHLREDYKAFRAASELSLARALAISGQAQALGITEAAAVAKPEVIAAADRAEQQVHAARETREELRTDAGRMARKFAKLHLTGDKGRGADWLQTYARALAEASGLVLATAAEIAARKPAKETAKQ